MELHKRNLHLDPKVAIKALVVPITLGEISTWEKTTVKVCKSKERKKVMCYVLRGLKPNMVPGLSLPGSSVPASILVTGSSHGTLQRSSKKSGPCQLCLGIAAAHQGINCGFRQAGRHAGGSSLCLLQVKLMLESMQTGRQPTMSLNHR